MKNGKTLFRCKNHIISLSLYLPFLTGIRAKQISPIEKDKPCIYYANHSSHLDGLVIWSSLAPIFAHLQCTLLPVKQKIGIKNRLRRYLSRRIFRCSFDPTPRE